MSRRFVAGGICEALFVSVCLASASAEPLSEHEWRQAGLWGGEVQAIEIDPLDPEYLLAGTSSGRVFVSHDGGQNWLNPGDPLVFAGWVVADLMFDPNQSQRVWAALKGVWEEQGFVAVSEDRGRSWAARAEGLPGRQVYSLAAVPGTPGALYAGTRIGVFGSQDHGRSWHHLTADRPEIRKVTSLLVDGERRHTVYAGTWRRAYRSDDGGSSWSELDRGMLLDSEVFSLHARPGVPEEVWASTCGWVYRGHDRGGSWTRYQEGLFERRTPSFQILPSGRLLAGTVDGLFFSDDDGSSWQRVGGERFAALSLVHHPARPERIFAGTEGLGVWRSLDGGRSFEPASNGLSSLRVAGLAAAEGEILAAVRHAGSASGVYSSFDGGLTFPSGPVVLPTVLVLAGEGERVFAGTEKGLFQRVEGEWENIESLGQKRVEQVLVSGKRVLARSGSSVFEASADGFRQLELAPVEPREMMVSGDTLLLLDRRGLLFKVPRQGRGIPVEIGREVVPTSLATSGFLGGGTSWVGSIETRLQQAGKSVLRVLGTGDSRWPLLLVPPEGTMALVDASREEPLRLAVSLPRRKLVGALVHDDRLLLATVGYGVLVMDLPSSRTSVGATTAR